VYGKGEEIERVSGRRSNFEKIKGEIYMNERGLNFISHGDAK
jgi:hypothetical protein